MKNGERRTAGKGTAWRKAGIHVLHLQGTDSEMAAQHGALLRDEIRMGPLPYLAEKNWKLMQKAALFRNHPKLFSLARGVIRNVVHRPLLAHTPRRYRDEARALSRAAEIPQAWGDEASVQADTIVLLLRHFHGKHLFRHMGTGLPGCTSIVACGAATGGSGVVHARNMDYPVVDRWDVLPTVFFCDPTGADRGQRTIGITSAGLHSRGVTAINESGITLSAHFHCAKATSFFGTPIQFIGAEITRRARTLGQAVDIAREYDRAGTWSFVLSSAKEDNAAVLEMVHGKLCVREPEDGLLAHTNHYRTPELQEREILLAVSAAQDFFERYHRAMELLDEEFGTIDHVTAGRILGDHFDRETRQLRSQGNTISVVTTITSMISQSTQGRFWVGNSCESPTSLGTYAGFSIDESFAGFDERELPLLNWATESKQRGRATTTILGTPKHEAYRVFRKAYVAFHTEYDTGRAADLLEKACAMDPEEGHYHLAHGHFRMRLHQADRALASFKAASACRMGQHMHQTARIFAAHALDALSRREEALEIYRELLRTAIDPNIRRESRRCLRKPYHTTRSEDVAFDMQFCDAFEYV